MSSSPRWSFPPPSNSARVRELETELQISPAIAELLIQRGYVEPEEARQFLSPRLSTLSDPFQLPDMRMAVTRILKAIETGEKIVLYGDYDVDGLTSLTVMSRILRSYGAHVECFLPHRKEEGYGLSPKAVARCIEEYQPSLLIAIDCGTTSVAEVEELNSKGVDVIILDHHECPAALPACVALVNPKRGADFGYLCSVGIVFKVAHALLKTQPNPSIDLKDYLDLVAVGTIADLVPLIAENRVLVHKGLQQLSVTKWRGIESLARNTGVKPPWSAADIGFKIGPRLNAAGRLGEARRALELLQAEDIGHANKFVQELETENNQRKLVGDLVLQAAEAEVQKSFNPAQDCIVVVGGREWHEGVIGIIASKLMHKYNRPCIIVGFTADGHGKGSGRSVPGFSLVSALKACEPYLVKFGGHEMAAGLSVHESQFESFKDAIRAVANKHLDVSDLVEKLNPSVEIQIRDISVPFLEQVEKLEPFGTENPQPLFVLRCVTSTGPARQMKEKHISIELKQNGVSARAIWFNGASKPLPPEPWDVAFELTRNTYQGRVQPQIQIKSIRPSQH